jgi:hypothetical protein
VLLGPCHGLDIFPATVNFHKNRNIYDFIISGDSARIPVNSESYDISLSMENLEHLYNMESIKSIKEMKRISNNIIITTPKPKNVIFFEWLHQELHNAFNDNVPLTFYDFKCLESAVHKSVLFENSMIDANFISTNNGHGFYFGNSKEININKSCRN